MKSIIKELYIIYVDKRVSRAAAQLSYFLVLSVFPALICLYAALGSYTNIDGLFELLDGVIPHDSIVILEDFLVYVQENSSMSMLVSGILSLLIASSAAFRSLHNIIGEIQGSSRYMGIFKFVASFIYSLVLMVSIYFAALVVVTGSWFLDYVKSLLPWLNLDLIWGLGKYIVLFAVLYLVILAIYSVSAPKGKVRAQAIGAAAASIALVAVSAVFSSMINTSARYPLVYGSLASVIILMVWLYTCGNVFIMGSALNYVIGGKAPRLRDKEQKDG